MVEFVCPKCGGQMSRLDSMIGQAGTCPHCEHVAAFGHNSILQAGDEAVVVKADKNRRAKLLKRLVILAVVVAVGIMVAFPLRRKAKAQQADACFDRALAHYKRGELDQAEQLYRKSLAINERLGRQEGIASAYGNLGVIYQDREDLDKAEQMYRKALEIDEQLGGPEGMANAYGNLGIIYGMQGKLDEAEQMHRKALAAFQRFGGQEGMANQYGNLGGIYQTRGDIEKTRELWTKARDLYQKIPMPHMVKRVQEGLDKLPKKGSR